MAADRALFVLHGFALVLASATALVWPRAGEAALLVPLGADGTARAIAWADAEQAEFLAIDPAGARMITRIPSGASLTRALARGILPLAVRDPRCRPAKQEGLS